MTENNENPDISCRDDVTSHFNVLDYRFKTEQFVGATLTKQMYHPALVPEHHWLHFTFLGFRRLHRLFADLGVNKPNNFCVIGTSSGLDAIGAWETLAPQALILTDILEAVLDTARRNVLHNCRGLTDDFIETLPGDLADPLIRSGKRVDVVYANLPTLPYDATQEQINELGDLAASFYPDSRLPTAPAYVRENLLELYYTLLQQLRSCLQPRGVVLCAIGGRRLWRPIKQLFEECNYTTRILVFDIKPQEQAEHASRCISNMSPTTCVFIFTRSRRPKTYWPNSRPKWDAR